jgi:uncharacterized membrane protein YdjX (TVP38/TMEM64 family)
MRYARYLLPGVLAVGAVVFLVVPAVRERALDLVTWMQTAGAAGVAVYFLLYLVGAVLLAPGSVLTAIGGFVFGAVLGPIIALPASTLGACAAFSVGRWILHDRVQAMVGRTRRLAAIDRAIARRGGRIILLLRLSPILPANLMNYAFGLTRIRLKDFAWGGLIGSIPSTIMWAYIGSAARSAEQVLRGETTGASALERVLFWGGLVVTAITVVLITRYTSRMLKKELAPAS